MSLKNAGKKSLFWQDNTWPNSTFFSNWRVPQKIPKQSITMYELKCRKRAVLAYSDVDSARNFLFTRASDHFFQGNSNLYCIHSDDRHV